MDQLIHRRGYFNMAARIHPNKPGSYKISIFNLKPTDQRMPKCLCGKCNTCLSRERARKFRERRRLGINVKKQPEHSTDFEKLYCWDRTNGQSEDWSKE